MVHSLIVLPPLQSLVAAPSLSHPHILSQFASLSSSQVCSQMMSSFVDQEIEGGGQLEI